MANPGHLLLALVVMLGMSVPQALRACEVPDNLASIKADLIAGINAQRLGKGLEALVPSAQLDQAAQKHACDNATRNRMSHTGSDGSSFGSRIKKTGYRFGMANENVGYGFRDPAGMLQGWMTSDGHRRNILARGTRDIGVGMARGSDGSPFWVMVSARPES